MELIRSGLIVLVEAKHECNYNKLKIKAGTRQETSLPQLGNNCPFFHKNEGEKRENEVNRAGYFRKRSGRERKETRPEQGDEQIGFGCRESERRSGQQKKNDRGSLLVRR